MATQTQFARTNLSCLDEHNDVPNYRTLTPRLVVTSFRHHRHLVASVNDLFDNSFVVVYLVGVILAQDITFVDSIGNIAD